jgi:hypothetical protein
LRAGAGDAELGAVVRAALEEKGERHAMGDAARGPLLPMRETGG